MNYLQTNLASIGDNVAKLQELSLHTHTKVPALTLMSPANDDIPATSFYIAGANVKQLYELLKQYYEEPTT